MLRFYFSVDRNLQNRPNVPVDNYFTFAEVAVWFPSAVIVRDSNSIKTWYSFLPKN